MTRRWIRQGCIIFLSWRCAAPRWPERSKACIEERPSAGGLGRVYVAVRPGTFTGTVESATADPPREPGKKQKPEPVSRWLELHITVGELPPQQAGPGRLPLHAIVAGEPWLTAAIPMTDPYCSCKLTHDGTTSRAALCDTPGPAVAGRGGELAVGETVVLLHPLSPCSRCFNMDGEGVPAKMKELPPTAQVNQADMFGRTAVQGPPKHELSSKTMALITSDYVTMYSPSIEWP